jgi:NADPH2 dehydrogenase
MTDLNTPIKIRNFTAKNRVALPPMVLCGLHPDGRVNAGVVEHYESFARGGCGMVIQEATCVLPEGKLADRQLGLWEDTQAEGMKRIADKVLPYGALLLVQLHYANKQRLSTAEMERIRDGFVAAASRAQAAGYHGVELHGAHGYLLCAFMNAQYNKREDRYGELTMLPKEILAGIRQCTGKDFIVTMRMSADISDMPEGTANAGAMEAMGFDLLHVSHGMQREGNLPIPSGFPFSDLVWRACEIKKHVRIPVMAVGGLNKPGLAARLVGEGYADIAAVGKGQLVDPDWANKTLAGRPVNPCLDCKDCVWFEGKKKCPGCMKAAK